MSCRLSHRLTNVHCAVSIALICSGSATLISNVQAATIGKTVITSAQHQPLTVRLNVTDIGGSDFSVSLANADIYQKMGLTPNPLMTVNFQPTSANSGDIYISTAEPVSKPFADVVLSIRDKGQRTIIPKTLLMPLDDSLPVNVNTTKNTKRSADSNRNSQPLSVRNGTPPPLLSTPNLSGQHSSVNEALIAKSAANNAPAHAA
ncbi:type IV pilus assembly protein FimV, partial [Psychrobacter sp.]